MREGNERKERREKVPGNPTNFTTVSLGLLFPIIDPITNPNTTPK
jgi:hypothetical protein